MEDNGLSLFLCNAQQLAEHLTVNQGVTGSSPVGGVIGKAVSLRTSSSVGRATDS